MKNNNTAFRSGFIAIVGRPERREKHAAQRLLQEKLAIVSSKPQTTRNRIMGVITVIRIRLCFWIRPAFIRRITGWANT